MDLFSGLQTAPPQTQAQPQVAVAPPKKKSDGFGGSLFDFDSMKKDHAAAVEQRQQQEQAQQASKNNMTSLLH